MTSLAVNVGGFAAKNPVWVGASDLTMSPEGIAACVEAGAGAVVAKSINESAAARRQIAISDCRYISTGRAVVDPGPDASLLNRSGLPDVPLEDWISMLAAAEAHARSHGSAIIGSITVASTEGAAKIAERLFDVVEAVEVNVGAPHGREAASGAVRQLTADDAVREVVDAVRAVSDQPLFVKLPGTASDIGGLARAAVDAGADAVTMMGRFNGFLPDVDTYEPVLGSWGAYGGPWCLPLSLYAVSKAHRDPEVSAPIIGTNGARDADDIVRFMLSGASAVEVVDVLWQQGPAAIASLIDGVAEHADRHEHASVCDLVGIAAERARTYAEIEPTGDAPRPWARHLAPPAD